MFDNSNDYSCFNKSYSVDVMDDAEVVDGKVVNHFDLRLEDEQGDRIPSQDINMRFEYNGQVFVFNV
jgi:hypothetical protein